MSDGDNEEDEVGDITKIKADIGYLEVYVEANDALEAEALFYGVLDKARDEFEDIDERIDNGDGDRSMV